MSNKYTLSDSDESGTDDGELRRDYQDGGRKIYIDPNGDRLNLSRLTAYAEHGEDVHEADVHHELPLMMIDASEFLQPLSREEHTRLHAECSEPVEVDGFPLVRADA